MTIHFLLLYKIKESMSIRMNKFAQEMHKSFYILPMSLFSGSSPAVSSSRILCFKSLLLFESLRLLSPLTFRLLLPADHHLK